MGLSLVENRGECRARGLHKKREKERERKILVYRTKRVEIDLHPILVIINHSTIPSSLPLSGNSRR